jgi:L-ascorbate metabolism protein UlaG (beta-lactamase superfamily)
MVLASPPKRLRFGSGRNRDRLTVSARLARAPETAKFLRRAAPAFFHEISRDYHRESLPAPKRPDPSLWPNKGLHAAWLGHSTVLLKIDGTTVLTDPVFSTRIGLKLGPMTLGIKRLIDAALPVDELPPIDIILLSHAHMDHFDLPSLRRLEKRNTTVITASRTADLLRVRRYARVEELRWRESTEVDGALVQAFEVAHWGARMRSDVYRGFNGYTLQVGRYRILFGGDTAYTQSFRQVKSDRPVDLAIMPIGAYDPWIRVHCNPEQAWAMANDAGARYILPVHHQTFKLSREGPAEPIERILTAAGSETERICLQDVGEEFHLA